MWTAALLSPYNEKNKSARELFPFTWERRAAMKKLQTPEAIAHHQKMQDYWDKMMAARNNKIDG